MKWSGCKRWWEFSQDRTSFVKTAEELCKRITTRDEDRKVRGFFLTEEKDESSKIEEERKKNKMKDREKLRIWDPAWENQMSVQIMGDMNLIVNWMNGKL